MYRRPRRARFATIAGVALSVLAALLAMHVLNRSEDPATAFDHPGGSGAQPPQPEPVAPPSTVAEAFGQDATPLIRTDFHDEAAWKKVVELVSTTPDEVGNTAEVAPIADRHYEGIDPAALADEVVAADLMQGYAILADGRSMAEAGQGGEVTVVYVDLSPYAADPEDAELFETFPGRAFRCVVTEVAGIEVNLSIANMDFHEFADNVGPDGVFRGF
jgi:hypothetical protein